MAESQSTEYRDLSELAPGLRRSLFAWWELHGRKAPLLKPWMFTKHDVWPQPHEHLCVYECWIAEVMLQQTQLSVMLPYWHRWMKAFPTVEVLVAASLEQVRLQWQGLGYYSRSRRLHEAAQILVDQLWPEDLDGWLALPGIGRTTAGGIMSSAFNAPEPILDGNVKRVLARLQAHECAPSRDQKMFWFWSETLLDRSRPRDFNQALMDLGATVCTSRQPDCDHCPWRKSCSAYDLGDPINWPVVEASKPLPFQVIGVGVVFNDSGELLIDQRLEQCSLGGMWEFPGGKQESGEAIESCIARELEEELGIVVNVGCELITINHAYSHKKLRFVVHLCSLVSGKPQPLASQQVRWVRPDRLIDFAFPAANARIIEELLKL